MLPTYVLLKYQIVVSKKNDIFKEIVVKLILLSVFVALR